MNAQTLSVVIGTKCNANCKFCISKGTYNPREDNSGVPEYYTLKNALRYAHSHGVDTLILTSKGEPMLYPDSLRNCAYTAERKGIPLIEIQTNGKVLSDMASSEREEALREFRHLGVTGISVSVAGETPLLSSDVMQTSLIDFWKVGDSIMQAGLMFRLSAVINNEGFPNAGSIMRFMGNARKHGVHQVTLRQMGVPHVDNEGPQVAAVREWVLAHRNFTDYQNIQHEIEESGIFLRELPWGAKIYDYQGMSVCFSDCLPQAGIEKDSWRSVILQPDGHVYHSWEYRGSILF